MSYAGLLNTTCTIEKATSSVDSTSREKTKAWASYVTNVDCRLDQASGGEVRTANDIYTRATHLLFLAYRTDLDNKDYRIVVGSNAYSILNVRKAGGMEHHTELDLEIVS